MSRELINRSPDLRRLCDEGYEVSVRSGFLIVSHIPYVNSAREIKYGTLVTALTLANDVTSRPSDHIVKFAGEHPCDRTGGEILQIKHQSQAETIDGDLVVNHSFSNKPEGGYWNYHHKITTYANIIAGPAQSIDPTVTARTFRVAESKEDSAFWYFDTATSRAGISQVSRKLEQDSIAIVGLGGTGSYVLDLVAKTPVSAIHLFDGDRFLQHNAFRAPGAPTIDELAAAKEKATFFCERYSRMHRNVVAHPYRIEGHNIDELKAASFVFICVDSGETRERVSRALISWGTSFIDVGMGVELVDDSLTGSIRITTNTPSADTVAHLPCGKGAGDDVYAQNIQIADLNALNAALAVIKWKKLRGFYHDFRREHHSVFTTDSNALISEGAP